MIMFYTLPELCFICPSSMKHQEQRNELPLIINAPAVKYVGSKRNRGSIFFFFPYIKIVYSLLFRVVKTTLSSSYNISGLVAACWLLFQCF